MIISLDFLCKPLLEEQFLKLETNGDILFSKNILVPAD